MCTCHLDYRPLRLPSTMVVYRRSPCVFVLGFTPPHLTPPHPTLKKLENMFVYKYIYTKYDVSTFYFQCAFRTFSF
jgi:hypothetical protein